MHHAEGAEERRGGRKGGRHHAEDAEERREGRRGGRHHAEGAEERREGKEGECITLRALRNAGEEKHHVEDAGGGEEGSLTNRHFGILRSHRRVISGPTVRIMCEKPSR
jgi:hypothetical protein